MKSAIEWMINKAQTQTLDDGTVEYFFEGNIPSRMKAQIKQAAMQYRSTPKVSSYGASGETWSWTANFGAYKSTEYHVKFSYADYTVPASKAGQEGE